MTRSLLTFATAIFLGLFSAPAYAATLVTPTIGGDTGDGLFCTVVNGADIPIEIIREIIDQNGDVRLQQNATVPPQGISHNFLGLSAATRALCRVEGKFSRRKVKVAMCRIKFGVNEGCVSTHD